MHPPMLLMQKAETARDRWALTLHDPHMTQHFSPSNSKLLVEFAYSDAGFHHKAMPKEIRRSGGSDR